MTDAADRFAPQGALALPKPANIIAAPYETLFADAKARLVAGMAGIGVVYDVQSLESDPAIVLTQAAVYRDLGRRQEIYDAVAATYLQHATGEYLTQRAADYQVLRRTLPHTLVAPAPDNRPADVPPAWDWDATAALWTEDDASLRTRARLAWSALSVAGPTLAYKFHALTAHPHVRDATIYGPESGHVDLGHVLVLVQSWLDNGVARRAVLDVIAAALDAYEIEDGNGGVTQRPVRDEQAIRPLGARVTVSAAQPLPYAYEATIFVAPGSDPQTVRALAEARVLAYFESRKRIGHRVYASAANAALMAAGDDGLPTVLDVRTTFVDVVPTHRQLAYCTLTRITVEVRG